MSDLNKSSLSEIINLIKSKKISSLEVTNHFINNIKKSKKLKGIPLAIKDLFCTKNIKTTAGSKILENFIPTYESTVTQNLWSEGAILLGKLNCD